MPLENETASFSFLYSSSKLYYRVALSCIVWVEWSKRASWGTVGLRTFSSGDPVIMGSKGFPPFRLYEQPHGKKNWHKSKQESQKKS